MNSFYRNPQQQAIISTPYRQVTSQYVNDKKPQQINQNYRVFPDTFNINEGNSTYQYKPKVIMSGYIVGEPVAFTQLPNLPREYPQFSPSKQNIQKPLIIQPNTFNNISGYKQTVNFQIGSSIKKNQTSDFVIQSINRSQSTNIKTALTSNPVKNINETIVNKLEYQNLLKENRQLRQRNNRLEDQNKRFTQQSSLLSIKQSKIRELENQIYKLRQQVSASKFQTNIIQTKQNNRLHVSQLKDSRKELSKQKIQQIESIIGQYIEKYKNSILQQQKLLMDRFRLQCKNQEIQYKKYQLEQSRKQRETERQRFSHRKISLHQRNQNQFISNQKIFKESFSIPLKSQQRQKHFHSKRVN